MSDKGERVEAREASLGEKERKVSGRPLAAYLRKGF